MKHFIVHPEIAGSLGPETLLDHGTHPPIVRRLHYLMELWPHDGLLETFPAFVVNDSLRKKIERAGLVGASFDEVLVTVSAEFAERHPGKELPRFYWLRVSGLVGVDDFGLASNGCLVVSERALALMDLTLAEIEAFRAS